MKIVLDTNVLISALGWKSGNEYHVVQNCLQGIVTLVLSPDTLDEFKRVVIRPKLGLSQEDVDEFITAILEKCEFVIPSIQHEIIIDDPSDNKFIDVAIESGAKIIVSGDRHLLDLKEFQGVRIMRAFDFLDFLQMEN